MINKEAEYRKLFKFNKRWAKHWTLPNAHRSHSSTTIMKMPAKKTLEFIESIDVKGVSYKEKVETLLNFYIERETDVSSYYFNLIQNTQSSIQTIEDGQPVYIPKMPRG